MKKAWFTLKTFFHPTDHFEASFRKDLWTTEIIRLMFLFSLVIALPVLGFQIAGKNNISETYPVYLLSSMLLIGWIFSKQGGWRWAGYIPAAVSFLFGLYGMFHSTDLIITTIFLFCLSVVLSGMLQGKNVCIFYGILSVVCFSIFIFAKDQPFNNQDIFLSITLFVGVMTAFLLQEWYTSRLGEIIKDLSTSDRKIEEEQLRRLQMEAITRKQESQIKRLTDQMTDLVAEIDFSGKYLYASPSFFPVLGYSAEEIDRQNAFELIHPDEKIKIDEIFHQLLEGTAPKRVSYRVKHANGNYIWVESSGTITTDEDTGQRTLILSSHDISDQKQAEESTRLSEKKFRSIIESIPLGIHMYAVDGKSSLVFSGFNQAAEKILGVDHSIFLGKTIGEAFPGLLKTDIPEIYQQVAMAGEPWSGEQVIYNDGKIQGVFDVHAFQTEPKKMAAVFSDITEERKAEEALQLSEEKFSKAFHMSPDAVSITRIKDGLFIEANEGFTRFSGHLCEDVIGKTSLDIKIWVNISDREKLVEKLIREGFYENLLAPFRRKDGKIIFGLMSARLLKINKEDYLLSITRDISERIEAEREMQEAHSQVEKAYEATLKGWARALELREHETANHSRRVVELSLKIGRELGLSSQDLNDLERGALLHDIGKMGVPDSILLKPGPLSDDEWVIMRQHPENAYLLLKDVDYLRQSLEIPYSHHERWDGTGYPRGLKGEGIPLSARIFTIVDVWDALLSDRPYRPAWNKQAVLKYLEEQSGKMFDPEIVKIFIKLVTDEEYDPAAILQH